ncbi:DUF4440 domain-containing protein [Planomonospora algeriensis]
MTRNEPADLERQGWQALSSTPEAAAGFYERILDSEVVMLLPGGLALDDRAAVVASMSGRPWSSYELGDLRVSHPTGDTGLVVYGAVARRDGDPPYSALISSLYVRRPDGWKLAFHQQTPR